MHSPPTCPDQLLDLTRLGWHCPPNYESPSMECEIEQESNNKNNQNDNKKKIKKMSNRGEEAEFLFRLSSEWENHTVLEDRDSSVGDTRNERFEDVETTVLRIARHELGEGQPLVG